MDLKFPERIKIAENKCALSTYYQKMSSVYTQSVVWFQKLCLKVVNKAKNDTRKECSPPPSHPSLSALARSDAYTKKNVFYQIVSSWQRQIKVYPFSIEVNERGKTIIWHVWKFCKDKFVRTHARACTVYGFMYDFYAWIEPSIKKKSFLMVFFVIPLWFLLCIY